MREFSVPAAATIAEHVTLTDPVWRHAAQSPGRVLFQVRTSAGWSDVTAAQFRDRVAALANGLIDAGVQVGDRVALMSRTRFEWTLIDYAIWAAGAVTVPIYESSSAEQVAWILSDSGAVACFVETDKHGAVVAEVRADLPALVHVWTIDGDAVGTLSSHDDLSEVEARRASRRADDVATIIYTSGTTGRPKGCTLTHRNLAFDACNAIPLLQDFLNEGARTLLFLPLAHSFARLIQIALVEAGATLGHTSDIKHLTDELRSFQPTFLLSVPRVFEKVFATARQRAADDGRAGIFDRAADVAVAVSEARAGLLTRLQHRLFDALVYGRMRAALGGRCTACISGGAPLGPRLAHFFRGIGIPIYEGYGLTETAPATAFNAPGAMRIGTVGKPLPGATISIGADGEILVAGDHVFTGYWNNPDATAEAVDSDGRFHTGDIGALDDAGYLSITGRKKEIIVTAGGKNVAPAVLEDRLRAHPLVSHGIVVGDRQPFIAALVTIDPDAFPAWLKSTGKPADATVESLRADPDLRGEVKNAVDAANLAVSHAEAIKEFRILPRDFSEATGELTPSMKIKRNVVLKEYADEIAAIYGG